MLTLEFRSFSRIDASRVREQAKRKGRQPPMVIYGRVTQPQGDLLPAPSKTGKSPPSVTAVWCNEWKLSAATALFGF
jgi:hypothetical protein